MRLTSNAPLWVVRLGDAFPQVLSLWRENVALREGGAMTTTSDHVRVPRKFLEEVLDQIAAGPKGTIIAGKLRSILAAREQEDQRGVAAAASIRSSSDGTSDASKPVEQSAPYPKAAAVQEVSALIPSDSPSEASPISASATAPELPVEVVREIDAYFAGTVQRIFAERIARLTAKLVREGK